MVVYEGSRSAAFIHFEAHVMTGDRRSSEFVMCDRSSVTRERWAERSGGGPLNRPATSPRTRQRSASAKWRPSRASRSVVASALAFRRWVRRARQPSAAAAALRPRPRMQRCVGDI